MWIAIKSSLPSTSDDKQVIILMWPNDIHTTGTIIKGKCIAAIIQVNALMFRTPYPDSDQDSSIVSVEEHPKPQRCSVSSRPMEGKKWPVALIAVLVHAVELAN